MQLLRAIARQKHSTLPRGKFKASISKKDDDAHQDLPRGTATFVLQCLCGVPEGIRSSFEEIYCWVRYLGVSEEELLTERAKYSTPAFSEVCLAGGKRG